MTGRAPMLDLPVLTVAARMAENHHRAAEAALERMKDRRDVEALHDFRVAVRRLRSVLRAYRRWLGDAAGRKIRRQLGELSGATNAGRDAEVQVAWLESQREALSRGERSGLNWLLRRRRAARRDGYESARRHGRDDFDSVAARLLERLGEAADVTPVLREVLGKLVRDHATALESNLAAVRGPADQASVHAARIRAKRLRYLIEPLRAESSAARELVRPLKVLQDVLGDLHDMHVLDARLADDLDEAATMKAHRLRELALADDRATMQRERRRDERLGIVALIARAQARRDELFAELERTWLKDRGPALVRAALAFADSLAPSSIPVERERKYLLSALPPEAKAAPAKEIEQGWLPGHTLRERLRHVRGEGGDSYFRTIKLGRGVERIEIEEETTAEVFAAMWPLTEGCRIRKRRYCVSQGDLVWEVDEFLDRDLVLAEVELDATDQHVPIPAWLDNVMVREVTDDPAYLNLTLATQAA